MKVRVEFLSLPNIVKMVGSKTVVLDFSGTTVNDLIRALADKYGRKVRDFLMDENGQLDMTFGVTLNQQEWIRRDQMDKPLNDGDVVTIMILAAGG